MYISVLYLDQTGGSEFVIKLHIGARWLGLRTFSALTVQMILYGGYRTPLPFELSSWRPSNTVPLPLGVRPQTNTNFLFPRQTHNSVNSHHSHHWHQAHECPPTFT